METFKQHMIYTQTREWGLEGVVRVLICIKEGRQTCRIALNGARDVNIVENTAYHCVSRPNLGYGQAITKETKCISAMYNAYRF